MIYLAQILSVGHDGSSGCIDVPQPPSPQMVMDILSAISHPLSSLSLRDLVDGLIVTRATPRSTPHTIYHQIQCDLRQSCSISSRARCISTPKGPLVMSIA